MCHQGRLPIRAFGPPQGLTLVEVLVATAVTAIAVLAGLQVIQATASGLRESRLRSLALYCLDSEIARLQIDPSRQASLPLSVICRQDGIDVHIELSMLATPHPNFRRIEARAYSATDPQPDNTKAALLAQRVYFQSLGF